MMKPCARNCLILSKNSDRTLVLKLLTRNFAPRNPHHLRPLQGRSKEQAAERQGVLSSARREHSECVRVCCVVSRRAEDSTPCLRRLHSIEPHYGKQKTRSSIFFREL